MWTLPVAFAAGGLFHLWVSVKLLPWWLLAAPIGVVLLIAAKPLVFPSTRRDPDGRTVAGLGLAHLGASLVINSLWPIVLLIPAVSFIVRWESVRETGGREGS
jgi:hypothetical protein